MQILIWLTIFFPAILFCGLDDSFRETEDLTVVHHVNVISGRMQLTKEEHVVKGAVPLPIIRSYSNHVMKLEHPSDLQLDNGWDLFPHIYLCLNPEEEEFKAYVNEPSGKLLTFLGSYEGKDRLDLYPKPVENSGFGSKNYRQDSNNHRLDLNYKKGKATIYLADGGKRVYVGAPKGFWEFFGRGKRVYLLQEEVFPSGLRTIYKYSDDNKSVRIVQTSPDGSKMFSAISLRHMEGKHDLTLQIKASDGRQFKYCMGEYLNSVESNIQPTETMTYIAHKEMLGKHYLESINWEDRPNLRIEYYFPENKHERKQYQSLETRPIEGYKVKAIFDKGIRQAFFIYASDFTDVRNVDDILIRYHHSDGLLTQIEYFDKEDHLYSAEKFTWEKGRLISRTLFDANGREIFAKHFVYDGYGNVIQESVPDYSKFYSYDKNHLLIEEREESGLTIRYAYLEGTDLLTHKWTVVDEEVVFEEIYEYDKDHLLIEKKIVDQNHENSERYTRDPKNGMITQIDTGLKQTSYTYDQSMQLIREEFDGYSICMDYDKSGRMIRKTFPLGGKNEYAYDKWNNLIQIKEMGSPKKEIIYDIYDRPIACNQDNKQSSMTYDEIGRVILERDYKGNTTTFEYDEFGRCTKKVLTTGDTFQYRYDIQGNVIFEELPNGAITRMEYTIFKKPFHIVRADGSEIWHSYAPNGEIKETTHPDGTKTVYEYDVLHRLICKKQSDLEERWEYDGILLKNYTNPEGLSTSYSYDQYGRKIAENCGGRKKEFSYDEYGFLREIREGELYSIEEHDIEGRVIRTNVNGFNEIEYLYDIEGRKISATKGDAIDRFIHDEEGRLISHVDPLSNETHFIYKDNERVTVDALGQKTIETFDGLSRPIRREKESSDGKTVFREEFIYDRIGNVTKRITHVFDGNILQKTIEAEFAYDLMGRLVEEIESGQKKTSYHYDAKGRLISKICPNGIALDYRYDDLDRIVELKSSDGTIWYEYIYEEMHLVEVKDHILGASVKRAYTKFGELATETGLFGHQISWRYDEYGRVIRALLPDASSIGYSYLGSCLTHVSRFYNQNELLYEHLYTKFDRNQHIEEERFIDEKIAASKRDLLERPTEMISPHHQIGLAFGPTSLVKESINSLTEDKKYQYDPLEQLIGENKINYAFDSIGNPKDCEINDLNQIVASPTETFQYDLNGNLIERDGIKYSYDALNRLKEIHYASGRKVVYTYDPFSRLVAKKDTTTKYYLYDKEVEIGLMDETEKIDQLKVLGLGVKGDIGAAIAIELYGERFIPLHDLQGNIIGIVNSSGIIIETYNHSAFGEEEGSGYVNPWRFASKRHEEGLIFFGKRFYDPGLKRFLTPDPIGFLDSRNLYLYVRNSPMNRLDQFGLESELFFPVPIQGVGPHEGFCNSFPGTHPDYLMPTQWIGRGTLDGMVADIMVICSRIFDLTFTEEEIKAGKFNFFDKIPQLIEDVGDQIAFNTFQNGIYNSTAGWIASTHVLANIVPKGSLIISLYNPTNGVLPDIFRTFAEKFGLETNSVKLLRALHIALLDIIEKYAPKAKAIHYLHSEAGAIYNRSFEGMTPEDRERMQNFFYCEGIAPAESIPIDYGIRGTSTYSKADLVTGWFANESDHEYDVRWVETKTPIFQRTMFFADHGIVGATYKGVLDQSVEKFNTKGGFYVGNQR